MPSPACLQHVRSHTARHTPGHRNRRDGPTSGVPTSNGREHHAEYTVVQFARRVHAGGEVAVKFFLEPEHFQAERRTQYIPALQSARLPLESVHGNEDGGLIDSRGQPLPPCVVMPRGVPLEEWMRREKPDILHAVAVRPLVILTLHLPGTVPCQCRAAVPCPAHRSACGAVCLDLPDVVLCDAAGACGQCMARCVGLLRG